MNTSEIKYEKIKIKYKGAVSKVLCPKTNELTLIVTCADCNKFKGYDNETKTIECEFKRK